MYLWLKALHLIFMVAWFAGLFYLPRLFVYHALTNDEPGRERFKTMERKLYRGIMTPAMHLTLLCGVGLIATQGMVWFRGAQWLHIKLALIAVLVLFHFYLGRKAKTFAEGRNNRSHVFYRWLNEFPVLILVGVILLAILKP